METQWWMDYSLWPPICFLCLLFGVVIGMLMGNIQGRNVIKGRVKLACYRLAKSIPFHGEIVAYQKLTKGVYSIVDVSHIKGLWRWMSIRIKHDGWIN